MLTFAISHRTPLPVRHKEASPPNKPLSDTYEVPSPAFVAFQVLYAVAGRERIEKRQIQKPENTRA